MDVTVSRNRMGVLFNGYQGKHLKVLTVCSAGCLRSPTAAHILSAEPFNFNTRCAGTSSEYAIIGVDAGLIIWSDVILCMDALQVNHINEMQNHIVTRYEDNMGVGYKPVHNLDIPDDYSYRDPELVKIMTDQFYKIFEKYLRVPVV